MQNDKMKVSKRKIPRTLKGSKNDVTQLMKLTYSILLFPVYRIVISIKIFIQNLSQYCQPCKKSKKKSIPIYKRSIFYYLVNKLY
jgi:hypothetical protein